MSMSSHYNLEVFPLPGKVIYFLHFNLHNWDKLKKKKSKTKNSLPVPDTILLILVILHLFSKMYSRSIKNLAVFLLANTFFSGKENWKENYRVRCGRLIPKQQVFHCGQLTLKSIGPELKKVSNHHTLLTPLLNGVWPHCIGWPLTVKSILYTNALSTLRKLCCDSESTVSPPTTKLVISVLQECLVWAKELCV